MPDEDLKELEGLISNSAPVKKLTDWVNEPTQAVLKQDLENAQSHHSTQVNKINNWIDLLKVQGKHKPPKIKGRSSIQPKLIRRQAEWRYSALTEPFLSSPKLYNVNPVTFEDVDAAKQNELVLNWQMRTKLNRVKLIDDIVRATADQGTCICKVGWIRKTKTEEQEVPVYNYLEVTSEEEMDALNQAIELKDSDPSQYEELPDELKASVEFSLENGIPTIAQQAGTQLEDVEVVLENTPTVQVLNYKNVIVDPTCAGDLDQALFVALSFETNRSELEKSSINYKNLDAVDWENTATVYSEPDHSTNDSNFEFQDKARKKVVAYEYWGYYDIHNDGELVPIIATWIGNTLIRMEENPMPDKKLPFVFIPYLPITGELYGEPDAELLEENQRIVGAVMRGAIDLLGRSANSQQGIAKGMLDVINKRRFDSGQDYEYNPVNNVDRAIIQHKYPELPRSVIDILNIENADAESLSGSKSFSGGLSGEAYGKVATGIKGMLDAASKREMAILRRIAKGIRDIGIKIISMNGEFLSDIEVVRVTNRSFVEVRRDDLEGNFDLEVDISTNEVDEAKSQDLAFILQTMGPNFDLGLNKLMMSEIVELKRMPDIAEKIRRYEPEPDPVQQRLAELEIENKELENEKLRSEIEYNKARAEYAKSMADKTNLDFVEQETGTKHERDKDLQKAQSEGNQNLAITKALVTPKKPDETRPDIDAAIGYNTIANQDVNNNVPDPRIINPNFMGL